jgi:hypothetical protein
MPVGMTDDDFNWAISAEITAQVAAYGGVNAYCRDHNYDKRNFSRYLHGRKDRAGIIRPSVPDLPELLRIIASFGITPNDFFEAANSRLDAAED